MAQVDVFAFGLVVLELTTMKRLDHFNSTCWPQLLESVKDDVRSLPRFICPCRSLHYSCLVMLVVIQRACGSKDVIDIKWRSFCRCPRMHEHHLPCSTLCNA